MPDADTLVLGNVPIWWCNVEEHIYWQDVIILPIDENVKMLRSLPVSVEYEFRPTVGGIPMYTERVEYTSYEGKDVVAIAVPRQWDYNRKLVTLDMFLATMDNGFYKSRIVTLSSAWRYHMERRPKARGKMDLAQ